MKQNKNIKFFCKKQPYLKVNDSDLANSLPEVFIILIMLLAVALSTIFFTNFKYYQIRQESMRPLFNNYQNSDVTDGVFVKIGSSFEVGDIVVLKFNETTLIKRVIATGGDKISIVKKEFPNRVEYLVQRIAKGTTIPYTLTESYINQEDPFGMKKVYDSFHSFMESTSLEKESIFDGKDFVNYLVLQEDEVFYLGDNRGNSLDSSRNGPAKIEDVIGKVEIVVWKEQNYLFNVFAYFLGFKNI